MKKPLLSLALPLLGLLTTAPALAESASSTLTVKGTLIRPPCTASFPASQSINIPKVNLNALREDTSEWTDVTLEFTCTQGSLVHLRFSGANGALDSRTLRTSLDRLGLKARLSDMTSTLTVLDLKLGEQLVLPIKDTLLKLKLSVRPVKTGQALPEIGQYRSTLLMEMTYL